MKEKHGLEEKKEETGGAKKLTSYFSPTTTSKLAKVPLDDVRQQEIQNAMAVYIYESLQPVTLPENKAFRKFVGVVEPRFQPTTRKTIEKKIHTMYDEQKAELMSEMSKTEFVGLTHDAWTSLANHQYDTVTVQYISEDWEMKEKVLKTSKATGTVVKKSFDQLQHGLNLAFT